MFGRFRSLRLWSFSVMLLKVHSLDPTDSIMDGDSNQSGYLPNHNMDPAMISGGSFGQIWSHPPTAGFNGQTEQFYAKPLVYTPSELGRQIVLVFSEQNRIYSLDAVNGTLIASRDLGNDGETPFLVSDLGSCNDISGTVGITGTPVIDPQTDTVYFWAKSYNKPGTSGWQNGSYRFHAVDATTLQEKPGFPTSIEGVQADNDKSRSFTGGNVLQRTSLNMVNGYVVAGFGGHCDLFNYTGWAVAMDKTGKLTSLYAAYGGPSAGAPTGPWQGGGGCGIWMAGSALASDNSGRIFFATGNAAGGMPTVNGNTPNSGRIRLDTLSEALVKLGVSNSGVLTLQDYFEPSDYRAMDGGDRDLGSGGVAIWNLPSAAGGISNLAINCGKNGICYIANADNLGGYRMGQSNGDGVLQTITPPAGGAVFNNVGIYPNEGGYIYITPVGAPTYAYSLGYDENGRPAFSLAGQTNDSSAGRVGAGPATITTLGGTSGTAILWVADPDAGARAYNAVPVNGKLTKINLPAMPQMSKFQRLAFGNGRYYTTTSQGGVVAYGAPVALPLSCSSPVNFGDVAIGSTSTQTVTCTAQIGTTILGMTIGNPLYQATNSSLPQGPIKDGTTFSFQVVFNLVDYTPLVDSTSAPEVVPGVQTTALMLHTSNEETGFTNMQPITLRGSAVSSGAYLQITPPQLPFNGVVLGSFTALPFNIKNLGQSPLDIEGYSYTSTSDLESSSYNLTVINGGFALDSNEYFTTNDLPAINTRIQPGSAVTIQVTFKPTTVGQFHTILQVWTNAGVQDILISGTGSTAPIAKLEVSTNEGGWNTIFDCANSPECSTQIDIGTINPGGPSEMNVNLRFTNLGGSSLIITKSKPPMGIIAAANPTTDFSEGSSVSPNSSATAQILFAPGQAQLNSPPTVFSGAWTLNTNDLSFGVHVINFTGTLNSRQTGPMLPNSGGQARYQYLGCFQDSTSGRIEPTSYADDTGMTNGACQTTALGKNVTFAATEYTKECWYGNVVPPSNVKAPDVKCTGYICAGDSSQFCGGQGGYMGVYYDTTKYNPITGWINNPGTTSPDNPGDNTQVGNSISLMVGEYGYAGCWKDDVTNRTLKDKREDVTTLTLDKCAQFCSGYKYFGTEYAAECYCAQTLPLWAAQGGQADCNMPCNGNTTQMCGGSARLSLYEHDKQPAGAVNGVSGDVSDVNPVSNPKYASRPRPGFSPTDDDNDE